jgi:hypothetical protein
MYLASFFIFFKLVSEHSISKAKLKKMSDLALNYPHIQVIGDK